MSCGSLCHCGNFSNGVLEKKFTIIVTNDQNLNESMSKIEIMYVMDD